MSGMYWKPFSGEMIVSRFKQENFGKILSEINSDAELQSFLALDYVHGMVAYKETGCPVAFAILIDDMDDMKKINIHGGCWSGSALDSYHAIFSLIENLFDSGHSVRTSCTLNNHRAYRFLHSVGFVNHYTSKNYHYFWLPYKRFVNTPIYKWFHPNTMDEMGYKPVK